MIRLSMTLRVSRYGAPTSRCAPLRQSQSDSARNLRRYPSTRIADPTLMNEPSERQRSPSRDVKNERRGDSGRERRAMDDRCAAVRRWIDEDDEPAVRGID